MIAEDLKLISFNIFFELYDNFGAFCRTSPHLPSNFPKWKRFNTPPNLIYGLPITTADSSEELKLKDLQMKLEAAYPECIEQSTKSPNGFAPHLTIAKFTIGGDNSKENVAKLITEWKSAFMTDPLELEIANEQAAVLFEIETLCTTAIGEGSVSVHLAGSTLMRFHDDASDIDILVCGPQEISHQVYFEALGAVHNSASQNERNKLELVSIVLDILIPIGRFRMGSVEIDLVYCRCGASNWENVSEKDLRGQSENYVRSLDGVMEADAIFGLIPKVWWPTYATSVHALKFWAKRRQIYSSVMGYLSSNTISLLLAKVILQTGIPSKPSTAEELFY